MQTVDPAEIERFSRIAAEWWNPEGKFKPLHRINPLRIEYIRSHVLRHFTLHSSAAPLSGFSLLDIGCGGGLIAEPMKRLGAHVTAVDASEKNIQVARLHAARSGLAIDYRCTTAEALLAEGESFDVVLALEIIEHVADAEHFTQACLGLTRPGGLCVFSTINRTPKSFALAIVGAEYILRWLPRGTHQWKKFIRPSEMLAMAERHGGSLVEMTGMVMHPLTWQWRLETRDMEVNYLTVIAKARSTFTVPT